jgi:signal-transduction protein with cAMP-binding, CBS, and nucleotidyltransferase domain
MTSPLVMVEAEVSLEEAMKVMDRQKIRRLGVSYKGQLEGIITDKDLLRLMPTLIDLVRERSRIQSVDSRAGPSLAGYCSRCEQYSNNLRFIDSELICEDCRAGF